MKNEFLDNGVVFGFVAAYAVLAAYCVMSFFTG
jgi:hypothetical protein